MLSTSTWAETNQLLTLWAVPKQFVTSWRSMTCMENKNVIKTFVFLAMCHGVWEDHGAINHPRQGVSWCSVVEDSQMYLHLRAYTYMKGVWRPDCTIGCPSAGPYASWDPVWESDRGDATEWPFICRNGNAVIRLCSNDDTGSMSNPCWWWCVWCLVTWCLIAYYFKYQTKKLIQAKHNKHCTKSLAVMHE